jgi:hypothetical protein
MKSKKKTNRIIWGLVSLVGLITIALSFGNINSYSQRETSKEQNSFEDLIRHIPVVDYNAPDLMESDEREERRIKNKRYDAILHVFKNPNPEYEYAIASDAEPVPPRIPYAESKLIIIGKTTTANAFLSNEKKGIYSEFSVNIETILKRDEKKELKAGETIMMDRAGGIVRYPAGNKMLYMNDWQRMPKVNKRYLLFLDKDDEQNPNYKLITGYQLENGKVTALDDRNPFGKYDGMSEKEFINLVVDKKQ